MRKTNEQAESKFNLTNAELAIMQVLWQNEQPVCAREINLAMPEKQWQRTTLATLLARLEEKGAVQRQKAASGNGYLYQAVLSEETYRSAAANSLLDNLYHGSVGSLAASLVASRRLSEQDIEELRELFKL